MDIGTDDEWPECRHGSRREPGALSRVLNLNLALDLDLDLAPDRNLPAFA
jgi:hypothetical protein